MADKEKKKQELSTDDAVILMFLSLVEEDGVEVPITLNMNGVVVSGTLIGATAYYEGITETAMNLKDTTLSKIVHKKFNDLKEAYAKQKHEQDDKEKEEQDNAPTFIHLKNAKYYGKDDDEHSYRNITWWRGRISSIDGFSFDSLD